MGFASSPARPDEALNEQEITAVLSPKTPVGLAVVSVVLQDEVSPSPSRTVRPASPYILPTLDSARAVRPLHPYGPCNVRVTRTRPKHPRNQLGIPSRSTRTSTSTRQRLPIPCHAGIAAARRIARQPPAGRHSSSILSPLHCAVRPLRLAPPTRPLATFRLLRLASPRLAQREAPFGPGPSLCAIPPLRHPARLTRCVRAALPSRSVCIPTVCVFVLQATRHAYRCRSQPRGPSADPQLRNRRRRPQRGQPRALPPAGRERHAAGLWFPTPPARTIPASCVRRSGQHPPSIGCVRGCVPVCPCVCVCV